MNVLKDIDFLQNLLNRDTEAIHKYAMQRSAEIRKENMPDYPIVGVYAVPATETGWPQDPLPYYPYIPGIFPEPHTLPDNININDPNLLVVPRVLSKLKNQNRNSLLNQFLRVNETHPEIPTQMLIEAFLAVEEENLEALANVLMSTHHVLKRQEAEENEYLYEIEVGIQDALAQQAEQVKNLGA